MVAWLKRHGGKATVAVLVLIPLVMLVSSAGAEVGQPTTTPGRWTGSVVGGLQAGLAAVADTGGGVWTRLTGAEEAREENEELRRQVDRLREENRRLIGVLQENARLRELVGFKEDHPEFELAAARVIARDVTPYFRVLKVRIRSDEELQPRMPVVAPEGVVGQVHRVYEGYADVVILADPRSRVDAISQRNRALGVVEGLGYESDYRARVAYLTDQDEVDVGDEMVTSGMGEVFPSELAIGTVIDVEHDERGLFQEVVVEPAVDFSRLEEVFVITDVR